MNDFNYDPLTEPLQEMLEDIKTELASGREAVYYNFESPQAARSARKRLYGIRQSLKQRYINAKQRVPKDFFPTIYDVSTEDRGRLKVTPNKALKTYSANWTKEIANDK